MKRVAWIAVFGAVTTAAACKRQVDMVLPDAGATVTTASAVAPSASAPRAATTDDAVEPLATLSSGRVTAPPLGGAPAARPAGDSGAAAAATAATGIGGPPTGTALPTGLPTGVPTGVPTLPPTVATTLPPPTATATAPVPGQPNECAAAKLMRQLGRTNEAETLRVKCVEKGGKDPFT
jgi:hypothetical protein